MEFAYIQTLVEFMDKPVKISKSFYLFFFLLKLEPKKKKKKNSVAVKEKTML